MTIIATAAIAHRSHAPVLAVSAMGGGLEIRPTLLRIAGELSAKRKRLGEILLADHKRRRLSAYRGVGDVEAIHFPFEGEIADEWLKVHYCVVFREEVIRQLNERHERVLRGNMTWPPEGGWELARTREPGWRDIQGRGSSNRTNRS